MATVEATAELDVEATIASYERIEAQWKQARREIPHIATLRRAYLKCGGDRRDFSGRARVLARVRMMLPKLLRAGVKCRTCGEPAERGHLLDDFAKFGLYLELRHQHTRLREKLIAAYFSQVRPASTPPGIRSG